MGRFDNYKTKCYWYSESQDMSATLVFCERQKYMPGWQSPIDSCPENCSHYITTKEVDKMVLHKTAKRRLWEKR